MVAKNEITGDSIQSSVNSKEYESGYEDIFTGTFEVVYNFNGLRSSSLIIAESFPHARREFNRIMAEKFSSFSSGVEIVGIKKLDAQ